MKKLILFALLASVPAFGQAYSSTALQNSPGNYSRAVPYAQITLCASTDTAVPCTAKAITYVDDTLTTQCTQTLASGVLTGKPAWGANCNNPGLADAYGNFTIFATAGNYRLCVYAQTWFCQEITIGGGSGGGGGGAGLVCSVAVTGSLGFFTSTIAFTCDPNMITDGVGNGTAQSWRLLGPVNGMLGIVGGGTSPGSAAKYKLGSHEFRWLGASVVTPYYMSPPTTTGVAGQVLSLNTQTSDGNGDVVNALSWINNSVTVSGTTCTLGSSCTPPRGISFVIYNSGGLGTGSTTASTDYFADVPISCTIVGWSLVVPDGSSPTITVKFWKVAAGTAAPTSSNSINTSGVSLATGTLVRSATVSDFTSTTVTAHDSLAMNITAVSGSPTYVNGVLECQ